MARVIMALSLMEDAGSADSMLLAIAPLRIRKEFY
jgi:hypothetical protein